MDEHTWLNALWRKDYFVIVENNLSSLFGNYVKCISSIENEIFIKILSKVISKDFLSILSYLWQVSFKGKYTRILN
jgi:hypothetical protein